MSVSVDGALPLPGPYFLPIFSRDVLRRIAANDDSWESMVPPDVAELIKRRAFFGYTDSARD